MTPQQLKNSILQRAIEGRLVEQRPEEGTANDLLKEIRAEKARLIEEGKIKKSKPLPPITEDEKPFEIPDGWEWVRLDRVSMQIGDIDHKMPPTVSDGIPYISPLNFIDNGIDFDSAKKISHKDYIRLSQKICPERGDIIFPRYGTIGVIRQVNTDREFLASYSCCVIKVLSALMDQKYIRYVLESPITKQEINRYINKTTQPNVGLKSIQQFLFPLPPLSEQHRIVSKIEELLPLIDKYDKAYTKLTDYNARFPEAMKKSILQYAIQGKLVEQRPEEGTAKDLLKEIRAEKNRLIEEGKIKKSKPLPPITEEEKPFEIPEGWEWVRLESVFQIINGDRGKNYPAKSQLSEHGEIPFISAINIKAGTISKENLLYVDEEKYNLLRSGHLKKGDLVLCIRGSLGKNGRYPFEKGAIASSLVILRAFVDEPRLYDFFSKYLNTGLFLEEIRKYDNGTAQPNLGARDLAKFLVPLPPLAEQHRIVSKIEELLPLCEKLVKSDAR